MKELKTTLWVCACMFMAAWGAFLMILPFASFEWAGWFFLTIPLYIYCYLLFMKYKPE